MIEKIQKRFLWLSILVSLGGIGYLASNAWGAVFGARNIQFSFEDGIPFVSNAVFAYLLAFPFLLITVFVIKKYNDFTVVFGIYAVIIFVSLAIFFQFPTTMVRPHAPESGIVGWLFGIMRKIDGPNNLFPSLHVSSVVFMALVNGYFLPKSKWLSIMCAVLISISTLLIKQHAILDVLGGGILGFMGYLVLWLLRRQ